MVDNTTTSSDCAQLQERIIELETLRSFCSGRCAQAIAMLTQVIHITGQIADDPALSAQSANCASRIRLAAETVIGLMADGIENFGDSPVLGEAIEAARAVIATNVPSNATRN
jgi:hypothetical protein